jgi:predicted dehydrogenase
MGVTVALNAGKHVLVEKPIALKSSKAWAHFSASQLHHFAEALWTFYLPKFDVLRQHVEKYKPVFSVSVRAICAKSFNSQYSEP